MFVENHENYKKIISSITNTIPQINTYREYERYLKHDVKTILHANLLSHVIDYNSNEDMCVFLLYQYEDKYIVVDIFIGTCENCIGTNFNEIIINAIEKAYVSTNFGEIKQYYLSRIPSGNVLMFI